MKAEREFYQALGGLRYNYSKLTVRLLMIASKVANDSQ